MNTLLLEDHQFTDSRTAIANERQTKHVRSVLKLNNNDSISVGRLGGNLGKALIRFDGSECVLTDIKLNVTPPPTLPFKLILAMPRPQMLKRILQTVAIFGVEELHLIQTEKVEKSFWQSPSTTDEAIKEHLLLGLEQAKATQLPLIKKHKKLRPFMVEALTAPGFEKLIAHPGAFAELPHNQKNTPTMLAIGPEGGFTEQEVDAFVAEGFSPVQLGQRILKVETAVTAFLGRLY